MLRILLTGPSNTGYESVFRFDVSGATVSSGAMQCGYSVDALTDVNISAGTLTISDYNPNINARTMNRTRVTGGKFVMTSNLREMLHMVQKNKMNESDEKKFRIWKSRRDQ